MSFIKHLQDQNKPETVTESVQEKPATLVTEIKEAEDILRGAGYKIKSVHGTRFGTEIELAKKFDEEDIEKLLKDFTLKFDDKSIFVID